MDIKTEMRKKNNNKPMSAEEFNFAYTDLDIKDATEGYRLSKPHKFSKAPVKCDDDKLIDKYLETLDVEECSRQFGLSTQQVIDKLEQYGVL